MNKKSQNHSAWYNKVIQDAKLADYGPARGTMVIRPYGFAIWELVQKTFDKIIKKRGVKNAYFPLFIPMNLLKKEESHIEGFSPELAVVTHGGGKKLAEPLAVRPTSETIMYEMYSKWISSWRDLPMMINQWNNVVRWEKRTYFFLRTLEFLWQEGHTAHATAQEAQEQTLWALDEYEKIYRNTYAIASHVGIKSESERFAGADNTYSVEILMGDNKVLQAATSHNLGQNFSKAFEISFQDKEGKTKFVHQTSWGLSTRSIGGLISAHGDDQGLVLPPALAPIKAVIIPILGKKDVEILEYCRELQDSLGEDIEIWDDAEKRYGWHAKEAELKGIPVRITIGPKELENKKVELTPRIKQIEKKLVSANKAPEVLKQMLKEIQNTLYENSKKQLAENTRSAKDYSEFKNILKEHKGFISAFWCEDSVCETKIKEETKATTRVRPLDAKKQKGSCIYCGKSAEYKWLFAHAY